MHAMASISEQLFARAVRAMPGGVNSPVRAFGSVGGTPPFIARGRGSRVWDVDGREYVDMVCSWGPLILGHAHPEVIAAARAALEQGTSFGAPTEREVELAELVLERYPECERIRFVNSGTEAAMSALRLARAVTGRDKLIKLTGNYHGHADSFLVAAGSGALTTGVPASAGVPADLIRHTLVAPFNDLNAVEELLRAHRGQVAALIIEPVVGNMGVVLPAPGYLDGLRSLTSEHGVLLIVDEVMTGFRLARGGAVELYGLKPDLVTWGKVIGGGLPVGAYGGRADLMDRVSPLGDVYQAGTLSGNPVAMAAGIATLKVIDRRPDFHAALEARSAALERALVEAARSTAVPVTVNRAGSMLTVFFTDAPVTDLTSAERADTRRFAAWFTAMLSQGIYWPPSAFEAAFISAAHEPSDVETIAVAAAAAFAAAANVG